MTDGQKYEQKTDGQGKLSCKLCVTELGIETRDRQLEGRTGGPRPEVDYRHYLHTRTSQIKNSQGCN